MLFSVNKKTLIFISIGNLFFLASGCQRTPKSIFTESFSRQDKTNGQERGNGGDVLVCVQPDGSSTYEMLDYYEARRRGNVTSTPMGGTWQEHARAILTRLSRIDPSRAADWQARISDFEQRVAYLPHSNLPDVPDTSLTILPSSCHLEQTAIFGGNRFPGEEQSYFIVSNDIWDRMDTVNKAALVLHEIIYDSLSGEDVDSRRARYLNGEIGSDKVVSISLREWNVILTSLGFSESIVSVTVNGLACSQATIEYFSSGIFKTCELTEIARIVVNGEPFQVTSIEFHENGGVRQFGTGSNDLVPYRDMESLPPQAITPRTRFFSAPITLDSETIVTLFDDGTMQSISRYHSIFARMLDELVDNDGNRQSILSDIGGMGPIGSPGTPGRSEVNFDGFSTFAPFSLYQSGWNTHVYCLISTSLTHMSSIRSTGCLLKVAGGTTVKLSGHPLSPEEISHSFFTTLGQTQGDSFTRIELQDHSGFPQSGKLYCMTVLRMENTTPSDCSYDLETTAGDIRNFPALTELSFDPLGRVIVP